MESVLESEEQLGERKRHEETVQIHLSCRVLDYGKTMANLLENDDQFDFEDGSFFSDEKEETSSIADIEVRDRSEREKSSSEPSLPFDRPRMEPSCHRLFHCDRCSRECQTNVNFFDNRLLISCRVLDDHLFRIRRCQIDRRYFQIDGTERDKQHLPEGNHRLLRRLTSSSNCFLQIRHQIIDLTSWANKEIHFSLRNR